LIQSFSGQWTDDKAPGLFPSFGISSILGRHAFNHRLESFGQARVVLVILASENSSLKE